MPMTQTCRAGWRTLKLESEERWRIARQHAEAALCHYQAVTEQRLGDEAFELELREMTAAIASRLFSLVDPPPAGV